MNKIKLLTLAVSVVLTACATTTPKVVKTPKTVSTNADMPVLPTPLDPKNVLAMALQTQVRSAFSYQTDVYVFNNKADSKDKKFIEDDTNNKAYDNCETIHDTAYIKLAKEAKQQNKDIKFEEYHDKTDALLQDYKACRDKENTYQTFDFKDFYEKTKDQSPQNRANAFLEQSDKHIQEQAVTKAFDKDDKTSQLLEEYLLKPSHVTITGRYEPYKGAITALPTFTYQAKNIDAMVNQPIYVDAKEGRIYFWADNLALANNRLLDKTLGDQWQNKWLYLSINDGSLPKDFTKELVKAFIRAKAEAFLALPQHSFAKIDEQELTKTPLIYQNLPQNAQTVIHNTPYIVRTQITEKDKAYSRYVFLDTFYHEITKKYPELTLENALGIYTNRFFERYIREGESVIHVSNLQQDESKNQNMAEALFSKMNSKALTVLLLKRVNDEIDRYVTEAINLTEGENSSPAISHYGIENGKVTWIHQRLSWDKSLPAKLSSVTQDKAVFLDNFTQLYQDKKELGKFSRLPSIHQIPNEQNGVNILDYKNDLVQKIKNSDDKYLSILLALLDMDSNQGIDEQSDETPLLDDDSDNKDNQEP